LEIGYSLIRKHWGKGYATEAAQFLKQWVFKQGITKTIISIIKTDNEDSKGVALKNVMIPSTELVWKDLDVVIYRVNNPSSDL
jgi:RimJ/RimL family protein N-acetyltransferase